MEKILLETIPKHMKDKVITRSEHGFMKEKSHLTSLLTFYNYINILVEESSSGCSPTWKKYRLEKCTVRWIENELSDQV